MRRTRPVSSSKEVSTAMKALERIGLNRGTSGNVSIRDMRDSETFHISPSAIPTSRIKSRSIRHVDSTGTVINSNNSWRPSSEWPLHAAIYAARSEVNAIVHTHSTFAVAFSSLRLPIPPFHYLVALAGGNDIRCAEYQTFGTRELASNVLTALEGREACLMANHGLVAVGSTLEIALNLAIEVEELCKQFLIARSCGVPELLNPQQMSEVSAKLSSYRGGRL